MKRQCAAAWRRVAGVSMMALGLAVPTQAAQQPAAQGQAPAAPGSTGAPGAQVPAAPGARTGPVAPTTSATAVRAFTGTAGLIFNTVRSDKAADFERLIAEVRAALEGSKDPAIQAMAKGWRFYKAAEPGPGNSVLYVFVIEPAVPGEDYGLGRILSAASTDVVALQETWKLYTSSVTGGGSLVNLGPIPEPLPLDAPAAAAVAPAAPTASAPEPK